MKRIFVILLICFAMGGINVNKIKGIRVAQIPADANKRFDRIENKLNEVIDSVLGGAIVSAETINTLPSDDQFTYLAYTPTGEMVAGKGLVQDEDAQAIFTPPEAKISNTSASKIVARGFYKNLALTNTTVHQRSIVADYLGLKDSSGNTVGVVDISLTCDISVAGPIINGRDQASAFASAWVYFFVIHNSTQNLIRSTVSLSQTAPTLPVGYDCSMYVGASYVTAAGELAESTQFNDHCFKYSDFVDIYPAVADTLEELDISTSIPPTAKLISGQMGVSTSPGARKGIMVASTIAGLYNYATTIEAGAIEYIPSGTSTYTIPILTAQKLYWKATTTAHIYYINIREYIDDI